MTDTPQEQHSFLRGCGLTLSWNGQGYLSSGRDNDLCLRKVTCLFAKTVLPAGGRKHPRVLWSGDTAGSGRRDAPGCPGGGCGRGRLRQRGRCWGCVLPKQQSRALIGFEHSRIPGWDSPAASLCCFTRRGDLGQRRGVKSPLVPLSFLAGCCSGMHFIRI